MCGSSYFNTPTFKYVVEDQTFFVHAGLMERWSTPLYCFISLNMKEKEQGFAVLKDVTPATFDCFLEWASKGFYTPPEPSMDPKAQKKKSKGKNPAAPATPPVPRERELDEVYLQHWGTLGGLRNTSGMKGKKGSKSPFYFEDYDSSAEPASPEPSVPSKLQKLREAFYSRKSTARKGPPPRKNLNASENYTDIFLCHAQLYVFAEKYDIQQLKDLAFEELHAVLAIFDLHVERAGDVGALFRYAYRNIQRSPADHEPLLGMLKDYLGYEMDTLMQDESFRELVKEDINDMLEDYMMQVMTRLKA